MSRRLTGRRKLQQRRFWGRRVEPGQPLLVQVPRGHQLLVSRACPANGHAENACLLVSCRSAAQGIASSSSLHGLKAANCSFRIPAEGTSLPIRLVGGSGQSWQFETASQCSIDVLGYLARVPLRRATARKTMSTATTATTSPATKRTTTTAATTTRSPATKRTLLAAFPGSMPESRKPTPKMPIDDECFPVQLPAGWAGLSFRSLADSRLVVTEVPKSCFSSAAFGAKAGGQVSGVEPGDEIALINGEHPLKLVQRISTLGDPLNTCGLSALSHSPGSVGKLASPTCISCDCVRRVRDRGLDVGLMLWIRAVKSETPITLGMRRPSALKLEGESTSGPAASSSVSARGVSARAVGRAAVSKPPAQATPEAPAAPAAPAAATAPTTPAAPAAPAALAAAATTTTATAAPAAPAAPEAPARPYNPLRPAASAAAATPVSATAKAKAKMVLYLPQTKLPGGLSYEEPLVGSGGGSARLGQEAELRFTLSVGGKTPGKAFERGQVRVRLGQGEVVDGWVDGNVDMEEVLGSWGKAVVGMGLGGKRTVHVPAKLGFRDGGGDVAPANSELLFEVELKKLF
ncbi:unnamed protein product [Polarella glacialis]|uniref:peptidylprolyl isomerase n=1 Tax=Polarella glacialis TaxID=89957 RepID=A0A813HV70_POLGL|nr:unnamed protein product [Polarella glacialis]